MADALIIQDLEASVRLGVHEWEQAAPQPVWMDLELAIDASRAAAHDDVREAVDYARLVAAVRERAQATPYRLLETMAEAVAREILREFGVSQVRVRIKKRALPGIGYAAVEVVRARRDVLRPDRAISVRAAARRSPERAPLRRGESRE